MTNLDQLVQPRVSVLNHEQKQKIHEYSVNILTKTGVRIDSARARKILSKAAGPSMVDGDRVRIPAELIEQALKTVPKTVQIYDRRGAAAFTLGDGTTHFGIGVTNLYYQDPRSDEVTPFTRQHMRTSVLLGNSLDSFEAVSTIGIIHDYPPSVADLYATLELVANTTKPLVLLVSDENLFPNCLDLIERLHGNLGQRPFVMPYFNPVTPLIINQGTGDKMLDAIERGLPVIYSNYSMAGMSTPLTQAGTLALLNAELLAGLVLSQLVRAGAPIILGSLPFFFDMKTMLDLYDIQSVLLDLACAEMMAFYRLPHCGTSGSGSGWGPDILASGVCWANQLMSCIGQVGLAPFVGSSIGSKAFSPNCTVYADEVIAQARRFAQGFSLDDDAFTLEEIDQTGPGGSFLSAKHTRKLFRNAYFTSKIFPGLGLEKWQAQGYPTALHWLRETTCQLLEKPIIPEDQAALIERGEAFIRSGYPG